MEIKRHACGEITVDERGGVRACSSGTRTTPFAVKAGDHLSSFNPNLKGNNPCSVYLVISCRYHRREFLVAVSRSRRCMSRHRAHWLSQVLSPNLSAAGPAPERCGPRTVHPSGFVATPPTGR